LTSGESFPGIESWRRVAGNRNLPPCISPGASKLFIYADAAEKKYVYGRALYNLVLRPVYDCQ